MTKIYEPKEDSFLLEKYVKKFAKGFVLDIGTGSGIEAKAASEKSSLVLGIDINEEAIEFCNKHLGSDKMIFLKSDLFSFFEKSRSKRFDTIIFNPPYLPEDEKDKDIALDGGKEGCEIIERFLSKAKKFLAENGLILLTFSSLTNKEKVDELIRENGFDAEELERIHVSFEDIYCYKITVK
jgi:release factor glutamine methyltransferase